MVIVRRKPLDNDKILVHHGVKDQKWGVRRGPPYPIDRSTSVSSLPTYILPKKEYAHVMSEVATHINDKQRELDTFAKRIGPYIYYFENMHDGTYRVLDKRRSKNVSEGFWDD